MLANHKKPEDLIGENGLLKQINKLLVEKALDAELTEHLGHERNEPVSNTAGNTRSGKNSETLKLRSISVNYSSKSPGTATAASNPKSSLSTKLAGLDSTTKLFHCMPAA